MKINYYICQQLTLKFIFIKKISIFAASLLFVAAAVTGYKAWQNSHLTPEEALMKANIEALARGEDENGSGECWHSITTAVGQQVLYCGTCEWLPGKPTGFSGLGTC